MTPSAKPQAIALLHDVHGLSVQRACKTVRLSRTAYYQPPGDGMQLFRDQPVIDALHALVAANTRWGFWKCYDHLRFIGRRGTTSACIACIACIARFASISRDGRAGARRVGAARL